MKGDDEPSRKPPTHGSRKGRQAIAVAGMDHVGASEFQLEQVPQGAPSQRTESVRNAQDVETPGLGPLKRMSLGGDDPRLVALPPQVLGQPEGSQFLSAQAGQIRIGGDDDSQECADREGMRTRMSVFSEPSFS